MPPRRARRRRARPPHIPAEAEPDHPLVPVAGAVEGRGCRPVGSLRDAYAVIGLGTAINVATIVTGTAAGLLIGPRIPERIRTTLLQGLGLVVLAIGLSQVVASDNIVIPLVAIVAGTIIGEVLRLEDRLDALGDRLRRRVERNVAPGHSTFVEGFVAATLLFCVGPMAILGSINDGLRGDISLLTVKSALDGLVSTLFAATLGWGVGFSALPVAGYQGAMTLLAGSAERALTDRMVLETTAAGGVMIMAIAVRLLEIKQIRVGSMLPALVVAPMLVSLFAR